MEMKVTRALSTLAVTFNNAIIAFLYDDNRDAIDKFDAFFDAASDFAFVAEEEENLLEIMDDRMAKRTFYWNFDKQLKEKTGNLQEEYDEANAEVERAYYNSDKYGDTTYEMERIATMLNLLEKVVVSKKEDEEAWKVTFKN